MDPGGRIYAELYRIIRAEGSHVNDTHFEPSRGRPRIVVGGDNREQSKRSRSPRPLFIVMRRDVDHGHV